MNRCGKKSRYIACFLRFRPEGKYYSLTQLRESDRSNNTYSPYTVHIESIYYCRYPIEIVYLSKKSRYRKTNIYSTESTTDYLKLFVVYISDIWCVNLDNCCCCLSYIHRYHVKRKTIYSKLFKTSCSIKSI